MSVSLASYSCPNILLCICQLQPYHAVQQHSFSELHNILLHTQLKMCPKKWWTIKKQPLHQRVWHFSLHKSTVAKKQQKNSRHWGTGHDSSCDCIFTRGNVNRIHITSLFRNNLSSGWAEEVSAPLLECFSFTPVVTWTLIYHYSWVPILLHTVCNIKPLNLNFCKL